MPKIIENVRNQLLAEAKRQIAERGYANTTIRSIAGECGLAVGTVYNYFSSKDMLIASFMVEDWRESLERIAACPTSDKELFLRCIYDELRCFSDKYSALFRDKEAEKVFYSAVSDRHKLLRSQLAELILPICTERDGFLASFVAEALLTWTMAGESFDRIANIIMKTIN